MKIETDYEQRTWKIEAWFCRSQATRMMDEEERQDTQMRDRFKAKWTPKPSAELTAQLRQEADKYRTIMENAVRADAVVREKYNKHRRNMDLLSKGEVRNYRPRQ